MSPEELFRHQRTEDEEKDESIDKITMLANIAATLLIVGSNEAQRCESATLRVET